MSCRQNFSEACEDLLNKQINLELYASHCYLIMASHFQHYSVALSKVGKYFKLESDGERSHAQILIDYINKRGGSVLLQEIPQPDINITELSLLSAFNFALELEKKVNESLLKLHKCAEENNDYQLADFLEGTFLNEQVEAMKQLSDHITNIKRCTNNGTNMMGEFIFNEYLKLDI